MDDEPKPRARSSTAADAPLGDGPERLALVEERLVVQIRQVETARVRISKRVVETEQALDVELHRERVDIERVDINRLVDTPAAPRQEGDVLIVPVYEEVLVRRWRLKEELRITRQRTVEQRRVGPEVLRREELAITRTPIAARRNVDAGPAATSAPHPPPADPSAKE